MRVRNGLVGGKKPGTDTDAGCPGLQDCGYLGGGADPARCENRNAEYGEDLLQNVSQGLSAADVAAGIELLRPARKGEKPRTGQRFFTPLRQVIESINDTFKGQLDLERHGGKTPAGVCAASPNASSPSPAAIWHNDNLGLTVRRSLTPYDH